MKHFYSKRTQGLLLVLLLWAYSGSSQSATSSYPFAIGKNADCATGTQHQVHYYTYNGTTNTLANASGGLVGPCVPQLRIGGAINGTQRFTSTYASVSYNPADQNIYYFWTAVPPDALAIGGAPRTYAWRWPVGTCPGTSANKLDTLRSFVADILGVAFDNSGNGYMIEFTNALPTAPPTYKPLLRSINFTTGVMGGIDTLALTGGAKIYQQGSGDVAISPSGQMFFIVDNKLFTPNYSSYTGSNSNLTCTYVDTVINSATGYFVGLAYAEGETISAYNGGGCPFFESDMLTASTSSVTKSGTVYSASDMASIVSGVGSSKRLVSATPTGTANQYTVVYDVYVKNYGNYPVTSVQVRDDLGAINGIGNVSNVSAAFVGTPPSGIALNGSYNGTTNTSLLSATGQTLPAYPVSQNSFTIRITCRLSNILNGTVYNNSAVATGTGFNSIALRDSSTNGAAPDLNTNDKPDDFGEGQPTPLLVAITAQTPPCATLGQVFYSQNFGTGTNASTLPGTPTAGTEYTGTTTQPIVEDRFMLTTNANSANTSRFISLTDHTTGTGRMMVVNADASNKVFYKDTLTSLCPGQQYSVSFWGAFLGNSNYQTVCNGFGGFKYPKVKMRVKDQTTGLVITEISTAEIIATSWTLYGMKFVMPSGYTNVIFEFINDGQGGCGNDIAFDDIQFGICDAAPTVSISAVSGGCIGGSTSMNATLSDPSVIPGSTQYQWQISTDNATWSDIVLATSSTYTIASVAATDVNKYYRVLVAATGNIGSTNCRYTSPGFLLTAKTLSTVPTAVAKNKTIFCPGDPVTLQVSGGTFGTNAVYRWYSGTCGSTLVGTGSSITVTPTVSTTYFVRIEGDCNSTTCLSIPVTINCDIDADDDGIPDVVESASIDPKLDDDYDGVPNWRDANYGGFTDTNADGVNDAFDSDKDGIPNFMDRDSDNDGIPDVVEAGGGDSDGNGIIDSYTDTDSDGFSQNVDANASGHTSSGNGLALPDLDADGIPNYIDLDSDNDGTPDVVEVYGADVANDGMLDYSGTFASNDTDGDGLLNSVDADANGDGVIDNTNGPLLKTGAVLANGRAGSYPNKNMDADVPANPYDLDSDGDGIADVIEALFADADFNGRIDGTYNTRGWNTTIAALGSLPLQNRDATGRANMYDIDADDDGIPDNIEGLPTASYLLAVAADADGDGIDNSYDNISGFGGKGITPYNKDGDTFPDYLDTDTDGDGMIDRIEGNDFNLNKKPDDDVALTGSDTDGDGLDNKFDNDNASAKGTSAYMGNSGSFSGPASPGSRTMVQLSFPLIYTDRDWRQVDYVLSLDFITFNGTWEGDAARLGWTVNTQQRVAHYEVQRSTDGVHFVTVKKVSAPSGIGMQHLAATDLLSGFNSAIVWYRVKAVSDEGATKLSSLVVLRKSQSTSIIVQILPNPVVTTLSVGVQSNTSVKAQVFIYDNRGSLVHRDAINIVRGYNTFTYPSTAALPNGSYHYHLNAGGYKTVHKFQIQR